MPEHPSTNNPEDLSEVFRDVSTHMLVSGIIRDQLTTNKDVREEALMGLDLTDCKSVLDIGCGFGFFSSGLEGRLNPDARVTGIDHEERITTKILNKVETILDHDGSFHVSKDDSIFICSKPLKNY